MRDSMAILAASFVSGLVGICLLCWSYEMGRRDAKVEYLTEEIIKTSDKIIEQIKESQ